MLLHDYLEKESKFPSPPTSGTHTSVNTITASELERHIARRDLPEYAFRDDTIVDDLLIQLERYLGEKEIDSSEESELYRKFNPEEYVAGDPPWDVNESEPDASVIVLSGPLSALRTVTRMLDINVRIKRRHQPENIKLYVDYRVSIIKDEPHRDEDEEQKQGVLVEVKAPSVMDYCDTEKEEEGEGGGEEAVSEAEQAQKVGEGVQEEGEEGLDQVGRENQPGKERMNEPDTQGFGNLYHKINLRQGGPPFERLMSKMASYMKLSEVHWATVTSHHKWVFLRRLDEPSVILYSTVELQEGNTRPFRALMAMLLASEGLITVPPPPQNRISIPVHPPKKRSHDDVDPSSGENSFSNDNSGEYTSNAKPTPRDPYGLRRHLSYDVELRWASHVLSNGDKSFFVAVPGTAKFPSLGEYPVRMQLHRFLGLGATGDVYGATLDTDGDDYTEKTNAILRYVVKLVIKDTSAENARRALRLRNEFAMYQKIEEARATGYGGKSIPRCYGLYESSYSLVLLLEYAGEPVQSFGQITPRGRLALRNTVNFLHALGICHGDITPRNVLKGRDMSYKLIDFTESTLHICPSFRTVPQHAIKYKSQTPCSEIKWAQLTFSTKKVTCPKLRISGQRSARVV